MQSTSFSLQDSKENIEKKKEWEIRGDFDEEKRDAFYISQVRTIEYWSPDELLHLDIRQNSDGTFYLQLDIEDTSTYTTLWSDLQKAIKYPKIRFNEYKDVGRASIEIIIDSLDDLSLAESFLITLDRMVKIGDVRNNIIENIKKYLLQIQNIPHWKKRDNFHEIEMYSPCHFPNEWMHRCVQYDNKLPKSKIAAVSLVQYCDGSIVLFSLIHNQVHRTPIKSLEDLLEYLVELAKNKEPYIYELISDLSNYYAVTQLEENKKRIKEVYSNFEQYKEDRREEMTEFDFPFSLPPLCYEEIAQAPREPSMRPSLFSPRYEGTKIEVEDQEEGRCKMRVR